MTLNGQSNSIIIGYEYRPILLRIVFLLEYYSCKYYTIIAIYRQPQKKF